MNPASYKVGCSYFPDRKGGSVSRVSSLDIINFILRARYVPRVITFPFRRAAIIVRIFDLLDSGKRNERFRRL